MKSGFWIIPAALLAALIFIATGCHHDIHDGQQHAQEQVGS